ncbi:hypothetical protein ACFROC_10010, partial [Nocardia tengchongensis]
MQSRVNWVRLDTTEAEDLISMLVCREHPDGIRIRPSRGDDGIDVLVPVDGDFRRVVIYQIKYFSQNLTAGQKTQIVNSHAECRDAAQKAGRTVVEWRLTLPLDPTPQNLRWLQD